MNIPRIKFLQIICKVLVFFGKSMGSTIGGSREQAVVVYTMEEISHPLAVIARAGSRYSTCLHLVVSPRYTAVLCGGQIKVAFARPASQPVSRSSQLGSQLEEHNPYMHTVRAHRGAHRGAHRSYNGAARWPFWYDKSRGQPSGVSAPVREELREKEEGEERVLQYQWAV